MPILTYSWVMLDQTVPIGDSSDFVAVTVAVE